MPVCIYISIFSTNFSKSYQSINSTSILNAQYFLKDYCEIQSLIIHIKKEQNQYRINYIIDICTICISLYNRLLPIESNVEHYL